MIRWTSSQSAALIWRSWTDGSIRTSESGLHQPLHLTRRLPKRREENEYEGGDGGRCRRRRRRIDERVRGEFGCSAGFSWCQNFVPSFSSWLTETWRWLDKAADSEKDYSVNLWSVTVCRCDSSIVIYSGVRGADRVLSSLLGPVGSFKNGVKTKRSFGYRWLQHSFTDRSEHHQIIWTDHS